MDKEIRDKHYEVIGKLQALETLAKFTSAMPSDRNTESMLVAVRGLLESAVLTATAYADMRTADVAPDQSSGANNE